MDKTAKIECYWFFKLFRKNLLERMNEIDKKFILLRKYSSANHPHPNFIYFENVLTETANHWKQRGLPLHASIGTCATYMYT